MASFDALAISNDWRQYDFASEENFKNLLQAAIDAKNVAYCPYSSFRVGAACLVDDESGEIIIGANVENASTPVGVCAERCMLAKAVTEGHKKFKAIAVATDIAPPASPCGMCRQFICEFCPKTLNIFMLDKDSKYIVRTLDELLPLSFGPDDLKRGDEAKPPL